MGRRKSAHQQRVEKFMHLAQQDVPDVITFPSDEVRFLRARLILEEALETINKGLGIDVDLVSLGGSGTHEVTMDKFELSIVKPVDMVELADGCADLSVVTIGTLSACGIADEELLEEVDESNLRKFGPGGYKDQNGKWRKPPDWVAPDIAKAVGIDAS